MLGAGIVLGLSELFIGKWLSMCVVTSLYCVNGEIALSCMFIAGIESSKSL